MVIVGGLGSLHGAIFGAIFVALLPPLIAICAIDARSMATCRCSAIGRSMPASARQPASSRIFGLILVLVILFEPLGIYGRWLKIKPSSRPSRSTSAATFQRQKSYMRSERLR